MRGGTAGRGSKIRHVTYADSRTTCRETVRNKYGTSTEGTKEWGDVIGEGGECRAISPCTSRGSKGVAGKLSKEDKWSNNKCLQKGR